MGRRFDLGDLLTGIGSAVGASNERLRLSGAPSLLREFTMEFKFQSGLTVAHDESTVWFQKTICHDPAAGLLPAASPNVRIQATFIAAPSLPVPTLADVVRGP